MNLMSCRLEYLKALFAGYQKTGISLLAFDGTSLMPMCIGDDIGMYVIIPKLACFSKISLTAATNIFFYSILIVPCISALSAFYALYQTWSQRLVAWAGILLLTRFAYGIGDLYLAYFACTVGLIPWCLYYFKLNNMNQFFFFIAGLLLGLFHYIRAYSPLATLLFIACLLIHSQISWFKRLICCCLLFCGLLLPHGYFTHVHNNYASYCVTQFPGHIYELKRHPLWHTMYLGFGFLQFKNDDNICWDDAFGYNKVLSIAPNAKLYSLEYETILKHEVYNLIRYNFLFVLLTLFAKVGILIFFMLKFAHVGLLAALLYPKPWLLQLAFLSSIAWSAIFPLIAIPTYAYALGFVSCVTLFSIVSIAQALECGILHTINQYVSHSIWVIRKYTNTLDA